MQRGEPQCSRNVLTCYFMKFGTRGQLADSGGSRGRRAGAAAHGTKGGGHQRGESKNNANLHDEKRD